MNNPLKRVKELIPVLPEKDAKLCTDYLSKRDFESVLEIVESDLYKAEKDKPDDSDEIPDEYTILLSKLRCELLTYMSYLEVPDNSYDYNYY